MIRPWWFVIAQKSNCQNNHVGSQGLNCTSLKAGTPPLSSYLGMPFTGIGLVYTPSISSCVNNNAGVFWIKYRSPCFCYHYAYRTDLVHHIGCETHRQKSILSALMASKMDTPHNHGGISFEPHVTMDPRIDGKESLNLPWSNASS